MEFSSEIASARIYRFDWQATCPMKYICLISLMAVAIVSCHNREGDWTGRYALEINGMKNTTSGELEVVGDPGDYFGRIVFHSSRERVYEVGLKYADRDSMFFILPGGGGELALAKRDSMWQGRFRYFGIRADVKAKNMGPPSTELASLTALKPLAPGVISTDQEESFPSYDHLNQTIYFCRDQKLYASTLDGSTWSIPTQLPFSADYNDSAPYVFSDGSALLFTSDRPLPGSDANKKNLWQVDKTSEGWSTPVALPFPINIDTLGDYHGAVAASGNVYFISYNRPGGLGRSDIFLASQSPNGNFDLLHWNGPINSDKSEADVYIDPEEKYLLFASTGRDDSFGTDDIYLSTKDGDSWSDPKNLGSQVNSYAYEYGAWVDEANGYLYFNSFRRGTSDIYRVKMADIEMFD